MRRHLVGAERLHQGQVDTGRVDIARERADYRKRLGAREVLRGRHQRNRELLGIRTLGRIRATGSLDRRTKWAKGCGHRYRLVEASEQRPQRGIRDEGDIAGDALDKRECKRVHVGLRGERQAASLLG